jgi:hypothetical protein
MANVVKFPKSLKLGRGLSALDVEHIKAALPRRGILKMVLIVFWLLVRVPLFLVLYWLRGPVVLVCNLIWVPMLFAFLFAWYAFPEKPQMAWLFGITSFVTFVCMVAYDFVLMMLSPWEMIAHL